MAQDKILLSTAYFPPVQYMSLFPDADEVLIEKQENYPKQTYRNRCNICSANGPVRLTVPVLLGSFHKTPLKDIRIDHNKKWQQVHLRSIVAAYRSAPFFEYYFDMIEKVIGTPHDYLLDLNMHSVEIVKKITGLKTKVRLTDDFTAPGTMPSDFRYLISPKNGEMQGMFICPEYYQVFSDRFGFIEGLSIIDLIFNKGPDASRYLQSISRSK